MRKNPDELRWLKLFHFELNNMYIVREDNFKICNPTNIKLDLLFHNMSWEEMKYPDEGKKYLK